MSTKQGNLLWNRMALTLAPGPNVVDTGIIEADASREAGDPPLGGTAFVGSRLQVLPCPPMAAWALITIVGEPVIDPVTKTVKVTLNNGDAQNPADVNAYFLDPHSWIGPGQADPYNGGRG